MNFPEQLKELKEYRNWVAWKLIAAESADKPPKKIPINPNTERGAMANNPATWGSYDEAFNCAFELARSQGLALGLNHGIGFEFGNSPYAGIDLDHCIDDKGNLTDWAADIVETMNSYTEYSPSKSGLHILFKGEILKAFVDRKIKGTKVGNIELYYDTHYFTVTGEIYGTAKPIIEASQSAQKVYDRYLSKNNSNTPPLSSVNEKKEEMPPNWKYQPNPDLLEIMFSNPKNGDKIRRLYNGDISGYPSHSEADFALCAHLAYYTGNNAVEMDRLFRASELMRVEKWDENHGGQTYGEITINKAIASTSNAYKEYQGQAKSENKQNVTAHTLLTYFQDSFSSDIRRFKSFSELKTGYSNLDKWIRLYPGLYSLGAISSLGKTTFSHQMADNIARSGRLVLYFSLEQTEFELASKGLARIIASNELNEILKNGKKSIKDINQGDFVNSVTAIDIKNGKARRDLLEKALAEYKTFAENEKIIELPFKATIGDIIEIIEQHADRKPVVFIDYLQIIKPRNEDNKFVIKDVIDRNLEELKDLSTEKDLVIFVINSFNRKNYLSVVDFESFKESGGIEYTSDVVWGLQLLAMNAAIYETDSNIQKKRKFANEAKNAVPRLIELAGLKNRYGRSSTRYFFYYFSPYDLFVPMEKTAREVDREMIEAYESFQCENGSGRKKTKNKD